MIERDKKGRYVSLRPARARRDEISGNGISALGLLLFLERRNISGLVTGGRRQLGDARREIKGDALFADPEDETLAFLIAAIDLKEIGAALAKIKLQGNRLPDAALSMTGR